MYQVDIVSFVKLSSRKEEESVLSAAENTLSRSRTGTPVCAYAACSIVIGPGITDMPPGSVKGLQMVVADVKEARDELVRRGAEVSEIEVMPWGSFVFFNDPDGNRWSLQQLPVRQ